VQWVRGIQAQADRDAASLGLVVESFIAGREYALEGMLGDGRLRMLALFDKPDPLDGPYFEETLYVTPSRLPQVVQEAIVETVQRACTLVGLTSGPVHAEMRVNERGVWLLEIAARSIGGLCGRILRHALGMSLEELILRHALDRPLPHTRHDQASGVMMIPIPRRGIFQGAHNLDSALQVSGITDIQVTASPGQIIAPPPEGASYLGFIFAQARSSGAVEISLREAHRRLVFAIQPDIPVERVARCPRG
jgi:biotin carboxylase